MEKKLSGKFGEIGTYRGKVNGKVPRRLSAGHIEKKLSGKSRGG